MFLLRNASHLQIMPLLFSSLFSFPIACNCNADILDSLMMDDTAVATLQRSLNEARDAKRKIQIKLAEIEAEARTLRSQLSSFDIIIEQTEAALRRVLFPADAHIERPAPPSSTPEPSFNERLLMERLLANGFDTASIQASDIETAVAQIQQGEQGSNVRFNDFRIPQAATIVLREANGSLHVSEIYRRMAAGGFEFRGQHQLITLAVSLSRSKRFRKVAPGTFELDPQSEAGRVA